MSEPLQVGACTTVVVPRETVEAALPLVAEVMGATVAIVVVVCVTVALVVRMRHT